MEDAGGQTEREASMNYWPGTKIRKSNGNAFTSWKTNAPSAIAKSESVPKQLQTNGIAMGKGKDKLNIKKSFTIYAKAKP